MWIIEATGEIIKHTKPIIINGVKYPTQIFSLWSKEQLFEIGIRPFQEAFFDTSRYWSTGFTDAVVDGVVIRTPILEERANYLTRIKLERIDYIRESYAAQIAAGKEVTLHEGEAEEVTYKMAVTVIDISQLKTDTLFALYKNENTLDIEDFDENIYSDILLVDVVEILRLLTIYSKLLRLKKVNRIGQIIAATTAEEVLGIGW